MMETSTTMVSTLSEYKVPGKGVMVHWPEELNGFSSHYQRENLSTNRITQ